MKSISIIIPSFKPTESLFKLVKELLRFEFNDITVINDGSPPEYNPIFDRVKKLGARVISIPRNIGKGDAIKFGIKDYLNRNTDSQYILFCDDDLQHDPEDVFRLAQFTLNDLHNFTIGERDLSQNIPLKSLIGNNFINYLIGLRHSIHTLDSQSGLRCFDKKTVLHLLNCSSSRFGFELEALIKLSKIGIYPQSIKIKTIYHHNNRHTRFRPFFDSLKVVWVALKIPKS